MTLFSKVLIIVCRLNFRLGVICSQFGKINYNNAQKAILDFRALHKGEKQNELCLSRTLFAASTSNRFKKNGVLFIGVFLPSKSMHAWIIEDDALADPLDGIWLNYQPIAAIYYE
jgi:hypothetical protein